MVTKTRSKDIYKDLIIRVKDNLKIDKDIKECHDSITKLR